MHVGSRLLELDAIRLGLTAADRWDAIEQIGAVFHEIGATSAEYAADMRKRELSSSTYIGRDIAIPHGTYHTHENIKRSALVVLQFPDGIAWGDQVVKLCIGIAATGDQQIGLLCSLAGILMDAERATALAEASDPDVVLALLQGLRG